MTLISVAWLLSTWMAAFAPFCQGFTVPSSLLHHSSPFPTTLTTNLFQSRIPFSRSPSPLFQETNDENSIDSQDGQEYRQVIPAEDNPSSRPVLDDRDETKPFRVDPNSLEAEYMPFVGIYGGNVLFSANLTHEENSKVGHNEDDDKSENANRIYWRTVAVHGKEPDPWGKLLEVMSHSDVYKLSHSLPETLRIRRAVGRWKVDMNTLQARMTPAIGTPDIAVYSAKATDPETQKTTKLFWRTANDSLNSTKAHATPFGDANVVFTVDEQGNFVQQDPTTVIPPPTGDRTLGLLRDHHGDNSVLSRFSHHASRVKSLVLNPTSVLKPSSIASLATVVVLISSSAYLLKPILQAKFWTTGAVVSALSDFVYGATFGWNVLFSNLTSLPRQLVIYSLLSVLILNIATTGAEHDEKKTLADQAESKIQTFQFLQYLTRVATEVSHFIRAIDTLATTAWLFWWRCATLPLLAVRKLKMGFFNRHKNAQNVPQSRPILSFSQLPWWFIALLGPFREELIYRYSFDTAWCALFGLKHRAKGALVSALLFGLLHTANWFPLGFTRFMIGDEDEDGKDPIRLHQTALTSGFSHCFFASMYALIALNPLYQERGMAASLGFHVATNSIGASMLKRRKN